MPQFLRWMMLASVPLLAACSQTVRVRDCDGVAKLTPFGETRRFIVVKDRQFAEQVAGHNQFWAGRGCWK